MSYGVGRRHGSDPVLLWLWCRLAAAALIGPQAWEPPNAGGGALKKKIFFLVKQGFLSLWEKRGKKEVFKYQGLSS